MMRMALGFLFEMLLFLTPASLPKTAFPGHPALVCFLVETEFAALFFWNLCGPIRLLRFTSFGIIDLFIHQTFLKRSVIFVLIYAIIFRTTLSFDFK